MPIMILDSSPVGVLSSNAFAVWTTDLRVNVPEEDRDHRKNLLK